MTPRDCIAARTCTCPPETEPYEYAESCIWHRVASARVQNLMWKTIERELWRDRARR